MTGYLLCHGPADLCEKAAGLWYFCRQRAKIRIAS